MEGKKPSRPKIAFRSAEKLVPWIECKRQEVVHLNAERGKHELTPRRWDVATRTCDAGNGVVGSSGDNVPANPATRMLRASQDTHGKGHEVTQPS